MTNQTGKDAGDRGGKDAPEVTSDDLDLVVIDEDAGKSDEDLWREMDAKDGEKAVDEEAGDDDGHADADADGAVDTKTDKSAADAKPNKGGERAKGGAAPPPDKKQQKAAADAGAAAEPTLAELKAERDRLVEANRRLEQSERSNRQRVSALQRKYEPKGAPQQAQDGKNPAAGKKKHFNDAEGQSFVTEYPEIAKPVAKALEEVHTELDELKVERARREQAEITATLLSNEKALDEAHEDWEEVAASKDFGDWLLKQPRYVQEAARRNSDAIVDAAEAVDLFDRFKAFRSSQEGGDQNTQRQGNGNGAQDGPDGKREQADGKNGNGLSGKRQRQLESSSGTRSTGPGLVDGIPEDADPQVIWDAMDRRDERLERQQRQRA
jgi:hypothetical protein